MLRQNKFLAIIGFVHALIPSAGVAAPAFHGLGFIPGGSQPRTAFGVSADGRVVVGGGSVPFLWREGSGAMSLAEVSCPSGTAYGVSPDGLVVAVACGGRAVRWSESDGPQDLGVLPGGTFSYAFGLSQGGDVIVGYGDSSDSYNHEAFRWTPSGGIDGLGDLLGGLFTSSASDVTPNGSVIVGAGITDEGTRAFRWTADNGLVALSGQPAGQVETWANAVSDDGSVVVGIMQGPDGLEAFRWTDSTGIVGLGDLPGGGTILRSEAVGVSGDGRIVVGHGSTDLGDEAFIWDADNGLRRLADALVNDFGLDLTGWQLLNASDISDDGSTIVGWGINPSGAQEAWRAVIPEPTAILLFALMSAWLPRFRAFGRLAPRPSGR